MLSTVEQEIVDKKYGKFLGCVKYVLILCAVYASRTY